MAIPRATRHRGKRFSATAPSASAEAKWLREQVDQSHLILDSYGVPRTRVGEGPNGKSVALTLAGRLRLLVGDPPRKARHAASNNPRDMTPIPAVEDGTAGGD